METISKVQWGSTLVGFSVLGTLSTGVIASAQVTVFEGLPPLPPSIPTLRDTPEDPRPEELNRNVVPIGQPPALNEFNFEAPTSSASPRPLQRGYRVEIPSDSSDVLAAVRTVEPTAFVRDNHIQAGLFTNRDNAQALQSDLRQRGLNARVIEMAGSGNEAIGGNDVDDKSYFVAIPIRGSSSELQTRIAAIGINASLVQERESARGDYIAIGPFDNREQANAVNSQVRAVSLDGRLYFSR